MSVCFRCPDCRNVHDSRLRARDGQWLATAMHAFGTIQELCPETQRWVRVGAEELCWAREAAPAAHWLRLTPDATASVA